MVLINPFQRPLIQLVMSHPATDKVLFPRRAPPWAGDISKLSNAQLRSAQGFAQFGINRLRGMTGTTSFRGNTVSRTAVEVFENYPNTGEGAFGGLTSEERRRERHSRADANLERLNQELQRRGARTGAQRVSGE